MRPVSELWRQIIGYVVAVLGVALTTSAIQVVPDADHIATISLLYLLVVIATAYLYGRGPAVMAALLAVLSHNWFFVEPRQTLAIHNPANWLALIIFLVTAIVIGQLTQNLRLRAEEAVRREQEMAALLQERQRLAEAESKAQALIEVDKLKTALLSMVSHDFRSPLAAIKASVTGLLQDDVPWAAGEQRELLGAINDETDRLNRMVGEILALSRLEAGAWQPLRETATLAEIIGATLDSFSSAENERIRVRLKTARSEAFLDTVQIVQVLHNLLENALKYSPPNSPVELFMHDDETALVIEVMDRGFGLPEGEEQFLFERFYRAARWRESALPGSGIGLALCRGLVQAHGGALEALNREGGGAIFRITLPLHSDGATL